MTARSLQVPAGSSLVVSTDTLVRDVHFSDDYSPGDIGYKALAVNLSDLAAMSAQPAWASLALTLPSADEGWIADFARGFFDLAEAHGVSTGRRRPDARPTHHHGRRLWVCPHGV